MDASGEFIHLCKYSSPITVRPVVLNESRFILIAVKNFIAVYDCQSFEHLFDFNIGCGKITSICPMVDNESHILVSTNIGQIVVCDIFKQVMLQSENMGKYIRNIISIGPHQIVIFYCGLGSRVSSDCKYKIAMTNLSNIVGSLRTIGNSRLTNRQSCAYSHYHKCLVVADKRRLRTIFTDESNKRIVVKGHLEVSCVSIHPSDAIYVVGYRNGSIKLYNIEDNSFIVNLHWHSNPVSDLSFSADGNQLYSGGLETVLVCWNIGEQSKHFLPRLGAEIRSLTVNESLICVLHHNNDISIVSSLDFKLTKKFIDYQRNENAIQLLWDKKSETLLLAGRCGTLNFYSPNTSTTVYTIDIVNQNFIGASRNAKLSATQYRVTHAILSQNNKFLFTVEQSYKNEFSRIKAWLMDDNLRTYMFKYCIESGHSSRISHINSYLDKNNLDILVTTSDDGFVKFWQPTEIDSNEHLYEWSFMNQISQRGKLPKSTEISVHKNIVAVNYNNLVAFHDLRHLNVLEEVNTTEVKRVILLPDIDKNLAVLSCKNSILLYNYSESVFVWNVSIIPRSVAFDPISSNICIFEKSQDGKLILTIRQLQDFKALQTIRVPYVRDVFTCVVGKKCNNPQKKLHLGSHIYFMSSDLDVYLISEEDVRLSKFSNYLRDTIINKNAELFESKVNDFKSDLLERYSIIKREKEFIKMLKSTQSHHLPRPEILLNHYLDAICFYNKEENELNNDQKTVKCDPVIKNLDIESCQSFDNLDYNFPVKPTLNIKFNKTTCTFE